MRTYYTYYTYYLIDNRKYLDRSMLSERLGVSRHTVRGLLKEYVAEVKCIQNKKIYPLDKLLDYAKQQIKKYEQETTNA